MIKTSGFLKKTFVGAIVSIAAFAWAHESHHKKEETAQKENKEIALATINEHYLKEVKPIFQKKCFDCHSSQMNEPWYRNIPGPKQLIDYDAREAKEHLDMDPNFPFKSHASPLEDLEGIEDTVEKGEMPPFRYRVLHPGSKLTEAEKETIQSWIRLGKQLLDIQKPD